MIERYNYIDTILFSFRVIIPIPDILYLILAFNTLQRCCFNLKIYLSNQNTHAHDITFTSLSRYFLKRSNRESEIIEVAFTLIAFGSSSTTFLFESFLRWARNLASWRKNDSTTRFSLNNLLRLLHFPFYGFSFDAGYDMSEVTQNVTEYIVDVVCLCISKKTKG